MVRKRKQLIQWNFLECGHAQYLQKIVEWEVHGHFFLDDRNERINRHGYPDMRPHRVLRRSIKRLDAKILLNPAEKQFDAPAEFVEGMELDGALAFAELGPRKKREAQVDRGGIEGEDCFLELQADVLVVVNSPGFGDEHLGEIGIDPPIAGFVGVGQVASRDTATDAHVVKSTLHGQKTSLDIAEAFPVSQLGESQTQELIETKEAFDFVIPAVTPHAFSEFVHRQKGHDLGEDGRLSVHRLLFGVRKSTDYTKTRSNRLRQKSDVSSVLRARWKTFHFSRLDTTECV